MNSTTAPRTGSLAFRRPVAAAALPVAIGLAVTASALAAPPRYMPVPVDVLERNCGASGLVPGVCTALGEDGSIAGEASCGSTTYGSTGFFLSPEGVLSELDRGSFTFFQPQFILGVNQTIDTGLWCPPLNGPCTTALVRSTVGGPGVILATSAGITSVVNDANMAGWAVGWGGASTTGAWRLHASGGFQELAVSGSGWGINAEQVSVNGFVAGSAYVSNQPRAIRWDPASTAGTVLPSLVEGTSATAIGVTLDGSVAGRSGTRAVVWNAEGVPHALLPEGSQSQATHIAGNPLAGSPLPVVYYGTHQDETRFFRATAPGVWQDLDPASVTGQPMDGARVIAAPHPSFMLATALTPMYQPVYFVWTQSGGLNNLASTVVDLPPGLGAMQAVDANASGCILVNTTGVRKSFLLTPLAMGDTNGDGLVNGVDLGRTLGAWGPVPAGTRSACDFDGDGKVDGADLGMLLTAWQP